MRNGGHFVVLLISLLSCVSRSADPQPFFDGTKWGFCGATEKDEKVSESERNLLREREVLIPAQFVSVRPFENGFAAVTREGMRKPDEMSTTAGKWGYIDATGNVVIPLKYDRVGGFDGELAQVKLDQKWGIVSKDGTVILPIRYDYLSGFHEGIVSAWDGKKHGFFDRTGRALTEMIYDRVDIFEEGRARVLRDKQRGWIDVQGKELAMGAFDQIQRFKDGRAIVCKDRRAGFAGKNGEVLNELVWQQVKRFQFGLAAVQRDGLWGFIDEQGRVVIQPQFVYADGFTANGLACVKVKDNEQNPFAFINREGRFAFEHRFKFSTHFSDEYAVVFIDSTVYKLAKDGSLSETQSFSYSKFGPQGPQTESEPYSPFLLTHHYDMEPHN